VLIVMPLNVDSNYAVFPYRYVHFWLDNSLVTKHNATPPAVSGKFVGVPFSYYIRGKLHCT
jgi:hypothetical protein